MSLERLRYLAFREFGLLEPTGHTASGYTFRGNHPRALWGFSLGGFALTQPSPLDELISRDFEPHRKDCVEAL